MPNKEREQCVDSLPRPQPTRIPPLYLISLIPPFLTYDPTIFALQSRTGARDGPARAGAAEGGPAGSAVEGRARAVSAG